MLEEWLDSVVGEAGDICVCVDDPAIPDLNNPRSVVDQKKKRNGTYSMQCLLDSSTTDSRTAAVISEHYDFCRTQHFYT